MSYKTNPIANRLKIIKGWKNSFFPTKRLNYGHQVMVWFKLYLFLKVYLALKNIQLLFCEIRFSETNTQLLYLAINKLKVKKRKGYFQKALKLKDLKSPLMCKIRRKNKFWLYSQKLQWLKELSIWRNNIAKKRILTKLWISKPRFFSWINLMLLIWNERHKSKINKEISVRKKRQLSESWKRASFFKTQGTSDQEIKNIFWSLKQKKLLSIFARHWREVVLLQKNLIFFTTNLKKNFSNINKITATIILYLTQKLKQKKKVTAAIYALYFFSLQHNFYNGLPQEKSLFEKKIKKFKWKFKLNYFLISLQKQLDVVSLKAFLKSKKPNPVVFLQSVYYKKTLPYMFLLPTQSYLYKLIFASYFLYLSKLHNLNNKIYTIKNRQKDITQKVLHTFLIWNDKIKPPVLINKIKNKTKNKSSLYVNEKFFFDTSQAVALFFKKKLKKKSPKFHLSVGKAILQSNLLPNCLSLFQLFRFQQKNQTLFFSKHKTLKKKKWKKNQHNSLISNQFNYRIRYRQNYLQNLKTVTNYKLHFLIQKLIYKYFNLNFQIKILYPLKQFKNLQFYRLAFPIVRRFSRKKKMNFLLKYYQKDNKFIVSKRYFYIGRTTMHLLRQKKETLLAKEEKTPKTFVNVLSLKKKSLFMSSNKKFVEPHLWVKKLNMRNIYFFEKGKQRQKQKQNIFRQFKYEKFLHNLIPTLILFVKYANPQILVDELAKIIKPFRKQYLIFDIIKQIFRLLPVKVLGYKIAITGRIAGARKTRLVTISKWNWQKPHQKFLQNINFATAQAKTRIGTFGIKMWVYF